MMSVDEKMVIESGVPGLDEAVRNWLRWDNEQSKDYGQIKKLVQEQEWNQLKKIMLKRLAFGTAGLRGRMGPGFGQMNDLVIIQTTQGLANYLITVHGEKVKTMGAVIGFDARHNSSRWARLAAGVFLRKGIKVYLFSKITPTPFVPFTVQRKSAAIGVMVTASHNPKDDNGYKVYWCNGPQILPPNDTNIQESILKSLEPENREKSFSDDLCDVSDLLEDPLEDTIQAYYQYIEAMLFDKEGLNQAYEGPPLVYTAMHGVGADYVDRAIAAAGFKQPVVHVKEQRDPDPEFPTAPFPNPEEGKTALNLSMETADANGSLYILANDPDADRLAVVQKVDGKWRIFSGNELGALIGWWQFKVNTEKLAPEVKRENLHFVNTTVSSKMLSSIAKIEGLTYTETLTGFKWMANKADEIEKSGGKVLLAFEEAIGYMCSTGVLDKDGVSAAVRVAELIAYLNTQNITMFDKMNQLYKTYGYHCSNNSYFLYQDPEVIPKIFNPLRHFENGTKNTYPKSIGEGGKYQVVGVRDLWAESPYDSSKEDKRPTLACDPKCEALTLTFHNGIQATLRTSGTEPKVKYYTEYCASPTETDWKAVEKGLDEFVEVFIRELIKPDENGLLAKK